MKKVVNGVEMDMTPEEVAQAEADEAAWMNRSPIVPKVVSRMQLLTALVLSEFITPEEAIAANTTVPQGVLAVLSGLTEVEQTAAKKKWLNFTEAHRNDSLVQALIASKQMTEQETDEFFTLAGSL